MIDFLELIIDFFSFSCRYDFLLVSQKANRGTVSPTSYNIIEDTTGLSADEHQQLAYGLTHLYYNWTVSFVCF